MEKFNKIESKYVIFLELGNEYGTSISTYDLSKQLSKFLGDVFK
jgi:hypothetical protein